MRRQRTLVQEARREEQHGNLPRAIELYRKALRRQENEHDAADPGLYNQLGDLYLRSGDPRSALACHVKALDGLEEQGLHRAAIALCKKILRNAPAQVEISRRTARLQARVGLLAEARESYIQCANRLERSGDLSGALEVLSEFAESSDDEEIRLALADRYAVADRPDLAVEALRHVWSRRTERGDDAEEIRGRIAELEGEMDRESLVPEGSDEAGPDVRDGADASSKRAEAEASDAEACNGSVLGNTAGLAAELQALFGGIAGEDRLRRSLPLIDKLLRLEPHQMGLIQRKMSYALAVGDEEKALEAYAQLGQALESRVSAFEPHLPRADLATGSTTTALEVGARAASAPGR